MKSIAAVTIATFFFCCHAYADHHKSTSKEDFKDWCDAWEGRWVGDVTWVADWPGLGKKGDKVTAYLQVTSIEDGNGLMMKFYGGNGSGTLMYGYDAVEKQIKGMLVVSGGFYGTRLVYRQDGKWLEESTGSLPDAKKEKSKSTLTFSNGGNTVSFSGSGEVDGKKTDPHRDVYRRVSK